MKNHLIISALIMFLPACSPTPPVVPTASTVDSNSLIAIPSSPASPLPQEVLPTTDLQPTPTFASASEPSGTIWLQILSPQDETVVNTPQVDVIGSAPAGAVVSINEEVFMLGDDGQFNVTVLLDEGPNLIEIIASDMHGSETSLLITVTYDPEW